MSTAFTVPSSADMIDALDVGDSESAINRLWRMYNQRRVVKAYPNDTELSGGIRPIVTPYQKYTRSGTGDLLFIDAVEPVATYSEAVIESGGDVQWITFWNGLLQSIYDIASGFVVVSEGEGGIEGMDYSLRSTPTLYSEPSLLFTDAGIAGIERRNGEDIETITGYGSFYEQGDIIGPWCFRDIAALLSLLKYRYFQPTSAQGLFDSSQYFGRTIYNLNDFITLLSDPSSPISNAWGDAKTITAVHSSGTAYVNASSWINANFSDPGGIGYGYNGATGKQILSPGYIAPRSDLPSMVLDFYGVAGLPDLYNAGGNVEDYDATGDIFRATAPVPTAVINLASLMAGDRPPAAPSSTATYVDLGYSFDADVVPIRDFRTDLSDTGENQARGFAMKRGFFVAEVTGYEFEGVI